MTDERIIAYLLDELPEEEAERFDEDCFAQADWPEQVHLVEENLIAAYLRAELPPERREHFEQNYLTTEARLEHVLMAAALLRHSAVPREGAEAADSRRADGSGWVRRLNDFWNRRFWGMYAAATLGLVIIISGVWWMRLGTPTQQTVATLALTISADRSRGAGDRPASVGLSPDVRELILHLKLPESATAGGRPSRVERLNEDGKVRPLTIEARDAGTVTVSIPAAQLTRGMYSLKVFTTNAEGAEQRVGGSYFFVVE